VKKTMLSNFIRIYFFNAVQEENIQFSSELIFKNIVNSYVSEIINVYLLNKDSAL
jgi:hypothetical protein